MSEVKMKGIQRHCCRYTSPPEIQERAVGEFLFRVVIKKRREDSPLFSFKISASVRP
jgi:hypothetical protein